MVVNIYDKKYGQCMEDIKAGVKLVRNPWCKAGEKPLNDLGLVTLAALSCNFERN